MARQQQQYSLDFGGLSGSTVYIGGQFSGANSINGNTTRNRAAAVDTTNGTATSWDPNLNNTVNALAVSGSTVYLGGQFSGANSISSSTTRNRAAAVDTTNGTATSWDPNLNNTVNALAVSGSTVYLGGQFSGANSINGNTTRNRAAAVDTTNGTATSWDPNLNNTVNALAVSGSTVTSAAPSAAPTPSTATPPATAPQPSTPPTAPPPAGTPTPVAL